jgi:hypothetical protein
MSAILGSFEYSNRIKIYWNKSGNIHTVTRHEQLDYEELCFEHTQPETLTTIDPIEARNYFFKWVNEFVS